MRRENTASPLLEQLSTPSSITMEDPTGDVEAAIPKTQAQGLAQQEHPNEQYAKHDDQTFVQNKSLSANITLQELLMEAGMAEYQANEKNKTKFLENVGEFMARTEVSILENQRVEAREKMRTPDPIINIDVNADKRVSELCKTSAESIQGWVPSKTLRESVNEMTTTHPPTNTPYHFKITINMKFPSREAQKLLLATLRNEMESATGQPLDCIKVVNVSRGSIIVLLAVSTILVAGTTFCGYVLYRHLRLPGVLPQHAIIPNATLTPIAPPSDICRRNSFQRVLFLDGGGVRGILTLRVLADLESKLQERHPGAKLTDLFDWIVGTSTGGLIAAGLRLGMSVADLTNLYISLASTIFPNDTFTKIKSFFRFLNPWNPSKYSATPLETVLNASPFFGSTRLLSEFHGLGLVTRNLTTRRTEIFTQQSNIPLTTSLRMTSAAPYYLPCVRWNNHTYVDGGLGSNNPFVKFVCSENFQAERNTASPTVFVSIGTGANEIPHSGAFGLSFPRMVEALLHLACDTDGEREVINTLVEHYGAHYHRLQMSLDREILLDSTDEDDLQYMQNFDWQLDWDSAEMIVENCLAEDF